MLLGAHAARSSACAAEFDTINRSGGEPPVQRTARRSARMLYVVLQTLLGVFPAVVEVHRAEACSIACAIPEEREAAFRAARAVFPGRVVARQADSIDPPVDSASEVVARLAVEARWKGPSKESFVVRSWVVPLCFGGEPFHLGEEYLVWAYDSRDEPDALNAGICTRTALLEHAADDLEFLGSPQAAENGCQVCPPPTTTAKTVTLLLQPIIVLWVRNRCLSRCRRRSLARR